MKTPDIAAETLPSNKLKVKLPALPAADLRKFFQDMRKDLWNWGSRTNLATMGPSVDGIPKNNPKQQTSMSTENQLQYRQVFMDGDGDGSGGSPKKPGDLSGGAEGTGKTTSKMINDIRTKTPDQLLKEGWQDVTDPRKAQNTMSREYYHPETGLKINYDPGKKGATGFEAVDHYHIHNPKYTDKKVDYYFDN